MTRTTKSKNTQPLATAQRRAQGFQPTDEGLELIRAVSPSGVGKKRHSRYRGVGEHPIPVPCLEAQRCFAGLLTKVNALKKLHAATAGELDALLPSILDKAFMENCRDLRAD